MRRKKDKIVMAIAAVSVLIENYFVYCYFEGERGFFDLLLCGIFVHIPVGLVVWAIANNCIREGARSKTEETASNVSSSTMQVKEEEQKLSLLQECVEMKIEKTENVTDGGAIGDSRHGTNDQEGGVCGVFAIE